MYCNPNYRRPGNVNFATHMIWPSSSQIHKMKSELPMLAHSPSMLSLVPDPHPDAAMGKLILLINPYGSLVEEARLQKVRFLIGLGPQPLDREKIKGLEILLTFPRPGEDTLVLVNRFLQLVEPVVRFLDSSQGGTDSAGHWRPELVLYGPDSLLYSLYWSNELDWYLNTTVHPTKGTGIGCLTQCGGLVYVRNPMRSPNRCYRGGLLAQWEFDLSFYAQILPEDMILAKEWMKATEC